MITRKRRSWLPFVVLIIVVVGIVFGSVSVFNLLKTRAPSSPEQGCVIMQDRGSYDDSIDIVFLAENYKSIDNFVEDTETMRNSFLNTLPYSEYKERFNFFRIESLDSDLGCSYDNDAVVCDPVKVKTSSLDCPYDYPVVLVEPKGVITFFSHLRSSSWRGIASVNSGDYPLVFAHEFGHQFSGLLDEYTWQDGRILFEGPNCDSQMTCPKFQVIGGSECHIGCINNENYRPIKTGIMRDYWESNRYGLFDEYIIEQAILGNSKNSEELGFSPSIGPTLVNLVKYECNFENTECEIISVDQGNFGYPSESLNSYSDEKITISQGEVSISVPKKGIYNILIVEGHDEFGVVGGEYFFEPSADILILPFDPEPNEINIESDGEKLYTYSYFPNEDIISQVEINNRPIVSNPVILKISSEEIT